MCKTYETVLVPIPQFIKADPLCSSVDRPEVFDGGEYAIDSEGRQCFVIDACLVPALQALWAAGIKTSGSCCGHGSGSGVIGLITDYDRHMKHVSEAPPYQLVEVVERRRHENAAYERGRQAGLVEASAVTALLASERLRANLYKEWGYAGGPNECAHGYAEGIDCPKCDEQTVKVYLSTSTA